MAFDPHAALANLEAEAAQQQGPAPIPGEGFDPQEAIAALEKEQLQAKYGGAGQQVLTGLESGASTLTAGLSTHVETALGVHPEDIAGREKANPKAKVLGEVAGIAGPAIASLGSSLPAEAGALGALRAGAEASAPSLISKVGGAVGKSAAEFLPEASSVLGKAGVGLAKGAAIGIAEGGLYGAGNVIHESALGDPGLTGESALTQIGLSALMGGGLSGAGGLLGGLAKGAAGSKLGEKLAGWMENFEGERNLKAAGAIQSDLSGLGKKMSAREVNAIGREAGEMGLVEPFSAPSSTFEKSAGVMESAGRKMGDALDSAEAQGLRPPPIEKVGQRVSREVLRGMEKNPFEAPAAARIQGLLNQYAEGQLDTLTLGRLHNIRREMDREIYGLRGQLTPGDSYYKVGLKKTRDIIDDEIGKALSGTDLGPAWKLANREYQVAATVHRIAEKGMERAAGNNPLGLNAVIMGAAGLAMHGVGGGALLGVGAELAKRYGSGVAGAAARMVRESGALGALQQLAKANAATSETVAELSGKVVSGARIGALPRLSEASIGARIEQVQRFAADAQHASDTLTRATDGVMEHAPQVAQAIQVTAARAAGFLASKVPDLPTPGPLAPKLQLSQQQRWQFGRYYQAVDEPTSVLAHAVAGTLTPYDVEALKVVYPQLYVQVQNALLDKLTTHKGPVPYRSRLMLAMLLGHDVDGTLTRPALQAAQAVFQRPTQKSPQDMTGPGAMGAPTQSGLAKLDVGSRAQTSLQASDARRAQ